MLIEPQRSDTLQYVNVTHTELRRSTCLVDIKINDKDPLQGVLLDGRCCRNRDVIENAEALAPVLCQTVTALSRPGPSPCAGSPCAAATPSCQLAPPLGCWPDTSACITFAGNILTRLDGLKPYRKGVMCAAGQAGGRRQAELQHRARCSQPTPS